MRIRSTFYYRVQDNMDKKRQEAVIKDKIKAIFYQHPYDGYRRITAVNDLIYHYDQGIQYACQAYIKILQDNNIKISMSAKGNTYENAFEELYLWQYKTFSDVVQRIFYFIEDVYNRSGCISF